MPTKYQPVPSDIIKGVVEYIKTDIKPFNVELNIRSGKTVNLGDGVGRCGGYFDGTNIVVASKNKKWFEILLHEYCHFLQYKDENKWYLKSTELNQSDKTLNDWLTGSKKFSIYEVDLLCTVEQKMELDCEKRVIKLIDKLNLPINKELYIKEANAYIFLYTHINKYGKWCKKGPARFKKIVNLMPSVFLKEYKEMPVGYEELVNRYCF